MLRIIVVLITLGLPFYSNAVRGGRSLVGENKYTVKVGKNCSGVLVHRRMVQTSARCLMYELTRLGTPDGALNVHFAKGKPIRVKHYAQSVQDYESGEDTTDQLINTMSLKVPNVTKLKPHEVWKTIDANAIFKTGKGNLVLERSDDPLLSVRTLEIPFPKNGLSLLGKESFYHSIDVATLLLDEDAPVEFRTAVILETPLTETNLNLENVHFLVSGVKGFSSVPFGTTALQKYLGYGAATETEPPLVYFMGEVRRGSGTCNGDWGSPLSILINDQLYVIGIHTNGFTSPDYRPGFYESSERCDHKGAIYGAISLHVKSLKKLRKFWNLEEPIKFKTYRAD